MEEKTPSRESCFRKASISRDEKISVDMFRDEYSAQQNLLEGQNREVGRTVV